jgi:Glu-tRNA(Gln) amidotransferase subunit E-like FAD-binding protein
LGVDLKGEVLEGIAVPHSVRRVGLGQADYTRVLSLGAVVLNDTLADLGNVQKTVKEVRSPVKVGGTVGDVVAEHAHALERTADLVRQVADDSLRGSIDTSPVASPA